MQRFPDWQLRLEAHVDATRRAAFVWGACDCALWAAGAVAAMTGVDLGDGSRGRYTTREEGVARARALGFRDHVDVFRRSLRSVRPAWGEPGDVVLLPGRTLGILQGRFAWALSEHQGLVLVSAEEALRAFKVWFAASFSSPARPWPSPWPWLGLPRPT